jgi:hypothetical protein
VRESPNYNRAVCLQLVPERPLASVGKALK